MHDDKKHKWKKYKKKNNKDKDILDNFHEHINKTKEAPKKEKTKCQ